MRDKDRDIVRERVQGVCWVCERECAGCVLCVCRDTCSLSWAGSSVNDTRRPSMSPSLDACVRVEG